MYLIQSHLTILLIYSKFCTAIVLVLGIICCIEYIRKIDTKRKNEQEIKKKERMEDRWGTPTTKSEKKIIEITEQQETKLPSLVKVEQMSLLVGLQQNITKNTNIIEILDKEESETKNAVLPHTVMMQICKLYQL